MNTRESIIRMARRLVVSKGFNAFSYADIAQSVGIKTASVHYHFPTKTHLGVAVIRHHADAFGQLRESLKDKEPPVKLESFFSIYTNLLSKNQVCIVGSLATDLHTVDMEIRRELGLLTGLILQWLTDILEEGRTKNHFHFTVPARTKALMIITNMLGMLQVTRLTGTDDFHAVKQAILQELTSIP